MHELSIAISIVEMAEEEAGQRGGCTVNAVHLKLGPLAGVAKHALLGSYELACEGTTLQNSRLIIEEVPVVGYCAGCRAEKTLASMQRLSCPQCGAPIAEIVSGRELEVFALEIQP